MTWNKERDGEDSSSSRLIPSIHALETCIDLMCRRLAAFSFLGILIFWLFDFSCFRCEWYIVLWLVDFKYLLFLYISDIIFVLCYISNCIIYFYWISIISSESSVFTLINGVPIGSICKLSNGVGGTIGWTRYVKIVHPLSGSMGWMSQLSRSKNYCSIACWMNKCQFSRSSIN